MAHRRLPSRWRNSSIYILAHYNKSLVGLFSLKLVLQWLQGKKSPLGDSQSTAIGFWPCQWKSKIGCQDALCPTSVFRRSSSAVVNGRGTFLWALVEVNAEGCLLLKFQVSRSTWTFTNDLTKTSQISLIWRNCILIKGLLQVQVTMVTRIGWTLK